MHKLKIRFDKFIDRVDPVRFFVVCATFFGLVFVVITPPFQAPDEPAHFLRAYQISEGNLVVDRLGSVYGGVLPKSLGDTIWRTANNPVIQGYPQLKYKGINTNNAFSIKEDVDNRVVNDIAATAFNSPVSYVPQSIGILIARLFEAPPILMMYLGRLANLITWIVLIGASIWLLPKKKWAFVFIGLLPTALSQAASLSTDVTIIGSVALFLAFILYIIDRGKKVTPKQVTALLLIATTMALSKQVIYIFLPLILLMPKRIFTNIRSSVLTKSLLIIMPLVAVVGWAYITKNIDTAYTFANKQDPSAQINFVLHSPHSFINILWNTHFYNWGDGITRSFIGMFGWVDSSLSESFATIGYLGLFLIMVASPDKKLKSWLNSKQKLLVVSIWVAYWLAVNAALYAYYTPVGFKIIYGLQGRYFLPLGFLTVALLYGSWLKASKSLYIKLATITPIVLLIAGAINVYVRYYINNV